MDFCATNEQHHDPNFRRQMRPFQHGSKDTSIPGVNTTAKQQLPVLADIDNDLLYLDRENSLETRPVVSGQTTNLIHSDEMILVPDRGQGGKNSEGTSTARKPKHAARVDGKLASATCRYSSWERAYHHIKDEQENSIVDSLSRILNETMSQDVVDQVEQTEEVQNEDTATMAELKELIKAT